MRQRAGKTIVRSICLAAATLLLNGCMTWEYGTPEEFDTAGSRGLFIVNEGNFQYGNSTLSYYTPDDNVVENEVFFRANGMKLGDVAQSMTIYGNRGWIAVNSSHVLFAIDVATFRETGRVENLPSPRYVHFVSDTKAYVTQLWDNRIFVIDPSTYNITGTITVPGMTLENGSTEQMVGIGRYVYCTCWSYQNRIIVIDTATDAVVDELTVGIQPRSIVADCNNKLWVLCDGGYDGSPYGQEAPRLMRIDPASLTIEQTFTFRRSDAPRELQINSEGTVLYWINNDVWSMDVASTRLPVRPLLEQRETKYYGLTIDPVSGEIYVADAIDYQQQGIVYRIARDGTLLDSFRVGINPGSFCWKVAI